MATTHTYKDLAASAVISGYKWLTSTLLAAQQKFSVRPYVTAQVIDDTIQPNAQFSGTGTPGGNGSMATAPNGTVYCVGNEGGTLKVKWDTALNAVAGVWRNSTVINTFGSVYNNSRNVYSIQISDYYKGSFRICIWFFTNFIGDGSSLSINLQYSDDGGITWTAPGAFNPSTAISNTSSQNLSLAAMKPVLSSSNTMEMGCFFITKNFSASFSSGFDNYDVNYFYGTAEAGIGQALWTQNANSHDWTIHSVGAYYLNGVNYCVISGFRNVLDSVGVNQNFSLWVTGVLTITGIQAKDLWSAPIPILPVGSASSTNLNSFTFPSASVINGLVYITFQAVVVDSLSSTSQGSTAQVVTTHLNYQFMQSDDGKGFTYPSVFVGTDGSEFSNGSYASLTPQNGFLYLGGGNGVLWELVQNNIVADVSQDVIGYQIQETADQPSSITIQIANANNKWVGSSPTGQGAAAISRNKKIALWQGYYNANGIPEAVPHSVYFIDDIQQIVTSTQNDITIIGRDLYKKLKTTVTKFSFNFIGTTFFSDIFDGTFISNWNQVAGTWLFTSAVNPPLLQLDISSGGEDKIMLVGTNGEEYGSLMSVFFRDAAGSSSPHSHVYFYAMYIDDNNWLRLDIDTYDTKAWKVTQCVSGSQTDLDSGNLPTSLVPDTFYGVFIRRYNYFTWQFMIELSSAVVEGNEMVAYDPAETSYLFKGSHDGQYDLSAVFNTAATWQTKFTVGMGTANSGPQIFRFFKYSQYNNQNNLSTVMRTIARIAGVLAFKTVYAFRELFFTPNFTGTFSVKNRSLFLTAGNSAMSQNNQPFSNGEISFMAKMTPTVNTTLSGFNFIFRRGNDIGIGDDYYNFHVQRPSPGLGNFPTFSRFERFLNSSGKTYVFYNSGYDVTNNPADTFVTPMNIDLTKWNKYKINMIDGWFWAFINDVLVAAWNDNNTTFNYRTTGEWGFSADSNTSVQIQQIQASEFWKPVNAFSYNPGDDAESAIDSLIASLRAWYFSDLFGRFKAIFLSSSDPSTYTYNQQLFQQNVDQSDKEYVSQVTVYGSGVSATARNTNLMPGVPTRESVVVDYTITTQQDAQTRASNELVNANQFMNQYTPRQVINVGAEMFDAVTITNTGNNTSGVSGTTRVYAQTFTQGGGNNSTDYSIELNTGNI